ncbi:2-keto-4-pentenoate hydratase, partial [Staphylococcus capitis]
TGLVVVGNPVDGLDNDAFANVHLNLYKDDKCIATGESSEVLGNPLNAIHWLIKKLHTHGKQLKKGDIISSGTFISPLKLE